MLRRILPLILLLSSVHAEFKTCYWPDGTIAKDETPCGDGSGHSACFGNTNDINTCLNGGLCLSRFGHVVRHACTDKTWSDSACPRVCTDKARSTYSNMVACDSFQLWACYDETIPLHNQCAQGNFTLAITPEITSYANVSTNYIRSLASSSPSPLSSGSAIPTSTPLLSNNTSSPSPEKEKKNTASQVAVGAGVGVPLFIALLAAVGMYILERRHRQRLQNRIDLMEASAPNASSTTGYSPGGPGSIVPPYSSPHYAGTQSPATAGALSPYMQQNKYEAHGQSVPELPVAPPPMELPAAENQEAR